jgi:hypothetical protein
MHPCDCRDQLASPQDSDRAIHFFLNMYLFLIIYEVKPLSLRQMTESERCNRPLAPPARHRQHAYSGAEVVHSIEASVVK